MSVKILSTQLHLSNSKTSGQVAHRTKSADIDHHDRPNVGHRDQLQGVLNLVM